MPSHLSEQANEALKSEYDLDFLGITKLVHVRELENRLIENIRDLLLELVFELYVSSFGEYRGNLKHVLKKADFWDKHKDTVLRDI